MNYITIDSFAAGYEPAAYVSQLRNYRSFVKGLMTEARVDASQLTAFQDSLKSVSSPVRATIMTEDWCGDAACNIPILTKLFSDASVELRIFRGSEHLPMKDGYESEGDDHIPVLSIWDGEFQEIGRWIESPSAIEERKEEWKSQRPEFMELYRARNDDAKAAKQFASIYRELLEEMASWYKEGGWNETLREVTEVFHKNA